MDPTLAQILNELVALSQQKAALLEEVNRLRAELEQRPLVEPTE